MTETVVVLGAGYAGSSAVQRLEAELSDAELVWVSDTDYHLVLHEAHRVVRDPAVREKITIPVGDIKSPSTRFVEGTVADLDPDQRVVELDDGSAIDYDYALVGLGSGTAFYGIPGLADHALTLKSLDDALAIHEAVRDAARNATRSDPAQVVVGGAGLSGIQTAGEIAAYRDRHSAPIDVTLVEALDEVMPNGEPPLQQKLREHLEDAGVRIFTDDPITEAEDDTIHFDEGDPLGYDVFVWTGGISGRPCLGDADLDNQHNRLEVGSDFRTSDDRVFAVGDTALIEQPDDHVAPPTAVAAWQAADVAAANLARAMTARPLERWTYENLGTLVSVGDHAVAHDVAYPPFNFLPTKTFDSYAAKVLKKGAAARWIAKLTSWDRAMRAWDAL